MLTDEQCHALVGAQLWAGMDAGAFGPECVYEALRAAYDRGLEDAAKVCEDDKDLYPGGSPVDRLERMASKQRGVLDAEACRALKHGKEAA